MGGGGKRGEKEMLVFRRLNDFLSFILFFTLLLYSHSSHSSFIDDIYQVSRQIVCISYE